MTYFGRAKEILVPVYKKDEISLKILCIHSQEICGLCEGKDSKNYQGHGVLN